MEKEVPVQAPSPKKRRKRGKGWAPGAALPRELGLATGGAAKPPSPPEAGEAAQPPSGSGAAPPGYRDVGATPP